MCRYPQTYAKALKFLDKGSSLNQRKAIAVVPVLAAGVKRLKDQAENSKRPTPAGGTPTASTVVSGSVLADSHLASSSVTESSTGSFGAPAAPARERFVTDEADKEKVGLGGQGRTVGARAAEQGLMRCYLIFTPSPCGHLVDADRQLVEQYKKQRRYNHEDCSSRSRPCCCFAGHWWVQCEADMADGFGRPEKAH